MLSGMFGNLFAAQQSTAPPSAVGSGLGIGQLQGLANQASNNLASQWHAQQQMAYSQALMRNQHRWMVNGVGMTFAEFLDTICPEPDDPMRTFLTLKYAGTR